MCLFAASSVIAPAEITASLSVGAFPPQPIGTIVGFTAAADTPSDNHRFRFRARELGGDYRVIRDYGPSNYLEWTPTDRAGYYDIEVTIRDITNGDIATATYPYLFRTRVFGDTPEATRTAHPLVLMYSAPACPAGSSMRVEFWSDEGETPQSTDARPCHEAYSMNILVAGLRKDTRYNLRHVIVTGDSQVSGPVVSAVTGGDLPELLQPEVVVGENLESKPGLILQSPLFLRKPVATDMRGRIVWYYPGLVSYLTRAGEGGRFFGIISTLGDRKDQVLREFDAMGNIVRETNAERVSELLQDQFKRPISSFHHEAMALPGGRTLVLGTVERLIPDVQGPGEVNIVGDMIIVLDRDLNVVWTWDATDYFDLTRKATLGETCAQGSCPPILGGNGNDWLHGTSVRLTPDSDLIYSAAHQDLVVKIDFHLGTGSGNILWKAGKDADFAVDDPNIWFSHQSDAYPQHGNALLVYDNAVATRGENGNSRGKLYHLNLEQRAATLALDIDLGGYSFVNGSAQQLPNGNYLFGSGWLPGDTSVVQEFDTSGQLIYALRTPAPMHRVQRVTSLYSVD